MEPNCNYKQINISIAGKISLEITLRVKFRSVEILLNFNENFPLVFKVQRKFHASGEEFRLSFIKLSPEIFIGLYLQSGSRGIWSSKAFIQILNNICRQDCSRRLYNYSLNESLHVGKNYDASSRI